MQDCGVLAAANSVVVGKTAVVLKPFTDVLKSPLSASHNLENGTWTIQEDGLYQFTCNGTIITGNDGGTVRLVLVGDVVVEMPLSSFYVNCGFKSQNSFNLSCVAICSAGSSFTWNANFASVNAASTASVSIYTFNVLRLG